jgi:hypothetical protein
MQNLFYAVFEAHHAAANHHRSYSIEVGRDLFGCLLLTACYGRAGCRGSAQRFASADPAELQRVAKQRLRRRLEAVRRIGCPYQLTAIDYAAGMDPEDWLPPEFLPGVRSVR